MASGGYDGSIKLGVTIEAESDNIVKNVSEAFKRVDQNIGSHVRNAELYEKTIKDIADNFNKMQSGLDNNGSNWFGEAEGGFTVICELLKQAKAYLRDISDPTSKEGLSGFVSDEEIQRAQMEITLLSELKKQYLELLNPISDKPITPEIDPKAKEEVTATAKELDKVAESSEHIKATGKQAGMSLSQGLSLARMVANGVAKTMNNVQNTIHRCVSAIGSLIVKMTGLGKVSKKHGGIMHRVFTRDLIYFLSMTIGIRGLIRSFKKLAGIAKECFEQMALGSQKFNEEISETKTLANTLKGSVGTMAQPIVSALLPALNAVIQALTEALILAAKFFAVLSGQNYILKATGAQVDYAKSLKGTGAAAKEAQKSLMGFDEINRLNAENNGGGGGGGTSDFTYEEVGIDPEDAVSRFAEMVRRAWQTGDFFDVGAFLVQKAMGWLTTFNNWLLTKGAAITRKIATSFATLINGIIQPDTGFAEKIGQTIANIANVLNRGLALFLKTTQWRNLGKFLAKLIMESVLKTDWKLLGENIAGIISAGLKTWRGFLDEFNPDEVGAKLGETIKGFFDKMGQVDPETGMTMWQMLGKNLSDSASDILEIITSALEQVPWEEVGKAIGEFLGAIDWKGVFKGLAKTIGTALGGIFKAIGGFIKENPIAAVIIGIIGAILLVIGILGKFAGLIAVILPIIGTVASVLGSLGITASMVAGALSTILPVLAPIIAGFAGALAIIIAVIAGFTAFIYMLKNGFNVIAGIFSAGIPLLIILIKDHGKELVDWFVEGCTNLVQWLLEWQTSLIEFWTVFLTDAYNLFVEDITKLKDWIVNAWEQIKTGVSEKIDALKAGISEKLAWIKSTVSNIVNSIKVFVGAVMTWIQNKFQSGVDAVSSAFTSLRDTLSDIWSGIGDIFRDGMNNALGVVDSFVNGIINAINGIISAFNSLDINLPEAVRTAASAVAGVDIPASISFSIPTIPNISVPRLARGAVLPPNKPFAAIVGDQKNGTNVEAPLDTIKLAVAEEMGDVKNALVAGFEAVVRAIDEKDTEVKIGDKEIGEASNRYNRKLNIMRGRA